MSHERLTTVLLGAGKSGKLYYEALRKSQLCELVAVISSNGRSARALGEESSHAAVGAGGDWLAYSPDLVVVASPHSYHGAQVAKSLDAGAHVIVDKPAAMNFNQLAKLVDAAANAVGSLYCGFTQRCNDGMTACRHAIRPRFRELRRIMIDQTLRRDDVYYDGWKGSVAMAGGGVLLNQAIHALDLVSYLTDAPVVFRQVDLLRERKPGIETTVRASYAAGGLVPISLSATTDAARELRQEILFEYNDRTKVIVLGSEHPSWKPAAPGDETAARRELEAEPDAYGPSHDNLVSDVAMAILSSGQSRYKLELESCLTAHTAVYQTKGDTLCRSSL
ncbi:Gfo/Idh/MocA family protein [Kribbella sp. CA-253562]|uniref:Gfo/Idh/MocA family protein n=1 Tax=Kribbella sp. CA-253562 TaxID=3239942 RepID=UPI003D8EB8F7